MPLRRRFLSILIALVTLLAVAGGFTSFERKRNSFERLDFQFHWDREMITVDSVDPGSRAEQAGIRPGDRIWMVGSTPSSEIDGLKKTLRQVGAVPIVVARGSELLTMTYEAPALKIDYRYLFLTFIGFLYLAIGLFTLYRGGSDESLLFYFVSLAAFIVYVYSPASDKIDATYKSLLLIEEFARILLPPLTLHFFLRFPRPLFSRTRTLLLIYAAPLFLLLWVLDLYVFDNVVPLAGLRESLSILDRWEMFHFAVYFTAAFLALTYTYRTAVAIGQKKQIKWIYLGMAVGFIPFLVLYLVPYLMRGEASAYTTVAILPLALIPLAFAVSILKYKLWDVEVVIKEVVAYTVTFIFGIIAFSTINLLLSHLLEERLALERNFLAFASGLLIAGVLVPVKGKLETMLEMLLYRDTYRHRRAMADFAQELATFNNLNDLLGIIRERLGAATKIHRVNLLVREGDSLLLFNEEPGVPRRMSVESFRQFVDLRRTQLDTPRLPDDSEAPISLLAAGYRYLFPLLHRGELQGLLLTSNKRGEEALSRDDHHLVESLTAPLALAIENARLYGRLRRQLEEIRSLKEYNENIIESSSSAIVVVGGDGTVLTANAAFWDLVGVGEDDQSPIQRLFPPYRILGSATSAPVQTEFTDARGVVRHVTVTKNPFGAQETVDGASVLVIADITERVRLERALQEKERLAGLGLLAAGVAHEVNTPLTGIASYAQLLLSDTSPDDPRYKILKKMELQTFRASHLVNNLLDFAANRSRPHEAVDLSEVIERTLETQEDLLTKKEVKLHVGEIPQLFVRGDAHELDQVLTNLVLNARDAVEPGGNVWISVREEGPNAVLEVRDDGRGIDPAMLSKIFEPLVTTKRGQGGTGLGLSICQRIVEGSGGSIRVTSSPGAGATFFVFLPLWTGDES